MRLTGVVVNCLCGEEFELFSDDTSKDDTVCWNWCPHCGAKKEMWIRFKRKDDFKLKCGISCDKAIKIKEEILKQEYKRFRGI